MEEEVAILKEKMSEVTVLEKAGMEFFKGILGGQPVVVVRSGIGKVNAGICTQILADVFQVNAVINTGIAGSLKAEINIGDIVLSTDTMQHDVDAREFGYEIGQVPRMDTRTFPADNRLRETALQVCHKVNPEIQVYDGDKETKEKIIANTQAYCTEMEGAAIGQAAYLNGIPYLVIRAISDKADDSAHMDYPAFEKEAIRHTVNLVENMMKAL